MSANWKRGFFFHFINNFAKELIKIFTQFLLNYLVFRINSISKMPETITTPYSSTQAAKEGTDITKMTSFLSKTFFFDFPLLKLSEYRQTKNPNSINHSLYFSSWLLLAHMVLWEVSKFFKSDLIHSSTLPKYFMKWFIKRCTST